jgi:hypothetical protein
LGGAAIDMRYLDEQLADVVSEEVETKVFVIITGSFLELAAVLVLSGFDSFLLNFK